MKTYPFVRCFALVCSVLALSSSMPGQSWKTSGTGNWFDTNNWIPSALPGSGPDVTNIINGGTAIIAADTAVVTQAFSIGYAAPGSTSSVGGLVIDGNGALTMGNVQTYIGRRDTTTTFGTGYVSVRGSGYWSSDSEISVGRSGNGSTGYLEIVGSGSVKSKAVHLGHTDTSVGTVLLTDKGRLTTGGVNSIVGGNTSGGSGLFTISGSGFWVNTANAILLGNQGSGTMIIKESGSLSSTTANATAFSLGHSSSGRGTLVVSGSSRVSVDAGTLLVGNSGRGNLTVEDNATVSALTTIIASAAGSSGTINLFGGVLTSGTLEHRMGIGALNFDGGTLRAKNDGVIVDSTNAASFSINTTGSGAFIDSGAFSVLTKLTIAGDGNVTKLGTGEFRLTGTQAYTGTTIVASGTLNLVADNAIASSSGVHVANDAVLVARDAQTLNNLSGGGLVIGARSVDNESSLVLNSTADSVFSGSINSIVLEKTGTGVLTLSNPGKAGQAQILAVNQGALNIISGTFLATAFGGTTTVASGGTLGITAGPARLDTGSLVLASGAAINALGYTPVLSSTFTLVTTSEVITSPLANALLFVDGQQVVATTDKYLHTYLTPGAGGKDLLLTSELFWTTTGTAHGTFNIAAGETFAPPVALADRTAATYTALAGWDGKSLVKTGAGTLEFAAANTYTGTTTIASGTLRLSAANAIASSAAINLAAGSALDITAGAQALRNLSGDGAIRGIPSALTLDSNADTHYNGTISSAGSVEKIGAGSLILGGTGAFGTAGGLVVSQGALSVTRGTLDVNGTLTLNTSATLGVAGGSAKITTVAATLANGSIINVLSGTGSINLIESTTGITATLGSITLRNNGVDGSTMSTDIYNTYELQLVDSGKTLRLDSTLIWNSSGQAHGTFNIADGVIFAPAVSLGDRATASYTAFAGWDGKSLTKTGLGTLELNIASTYSGTTTINNGTLRLGAANAIASSTAVNLAAGLMEAQGSQQTLQNLAGSGTLKNTAITTLQSSADTTFAGLITGAGSIIKAGANTLTLSGSNDYTGGSTISAGKLVAANAAALGTGTVTNNASLEFASAANGVFEASLVGTGSFAKTGAGALTAIGPVFKTASATVSGGTLSLGDTTHAITGSAASVSVGSAAALIVGADSTLDVGGTLSLDANSTLGFIIGSGTGPVIRANGATIGAGVTLNLAGITGNTEMPFHVLATDNGITNDFANITIGGATGGTADYITVSAGKTDDGKTYKLDTFLTWIQTSDVRHGTFTLTDAAESFTIGQVLANNTANPVTGWDGKSLTKSGSGTLILAAANTYTGTTLVNAGMLRLDTENAIAASTEVRIAAEAVLAAATGTQTLHNLTGSGTLLNSTFSILNSTSDTVFGGVVTGSGAIAKTGAATLALSGANDYSGGTFITEGRLKAAAPSALGSGEIVNNAVLELTVDADAALANTLSGTGTFIKDGAATLTLTNSNTAFNGTARIDAGKILLTNATALGSSDIVAAAGVTVEYSGIANATSQSAVMGAGTFVVTSSTLALAKGGAGVRDVFVNNSKLTLAHEHALGDNIARVSVGAGSQLLFAANGIRLDTVALTPGSTLGFAPPTSTIAPNTATIANLSLTGSANLLFNINLGRASSGVTTGGVISDFLRVTDSLSGTYSVTVNPGAYRPTTFGISVELINTPAPTAADAFALTGTSPKITIGLIAYELLQGNGTSLLPNQNSWYLADTGISPVADVIFSAAAMAGAEWHYSLDSLNLRLGDIRATTFDGDDRPDADRWMRVRGYRLDAESSLTGAAFHQYVYGVTVGVDKIFHLENSSIIIGALADAGLVNRIFENGASGDTRTISGGLYASWLHKAGWYADGVAKYDHNENSFNVRALVGQPDDTEYKNDVQGLSLELGRRIQGADGWWMELAAQGAIAWIGGAEYNTYPDHLKLRVEVEDATSVQYRGQIRFGRQLFSTNFHPYARVGMANSETYGGKIIAAGLRRKVDFDGWRAEVGGGFAWHLSPESQLYLDYEYAHAESYKRPWSFNLGYRRAW